MDKVDLSLGSSKGGRDPRAPRADTSCAASTPQTQQPCPVLKGQAKGSILEKWERWEQAPRERV